MTESATGDFQDLPGFMVRRMQQAAVSVFMARMGEAGEELTPLQFAALNATRQQPGIGQAELGGRIACDRSTVGNMVDRMVKKGLLNRTHSETDRRARELYLSEEGAALLDRVAPVVAAIQAEIVSGLSGGEAEEFIRLLRKASEALDDTNRVALHSAD